MTDEVIADLEKSWLAAETMADELKHEAERMSAEVRVSDNDKLKVLLNQSEELKARHAAADKAASEAFDRLWQARDVGGAAQLSAK